MDEKRTPTYKYIKWILFGIIFFSCLLYSIYANINVFCFDAEYYWGIGNVDLMSFPATFRGCIFPWILALFKTVFGDGVWTWRIISALFVSSLFAFALPYALEGKSIDTKKSAFRELIAFIVFIFFWGDLIQYPLSDMVSCVFLISGIALLRGIFNSEKKINCGSIIKALAGGAMFYAAYNTRVVFLFGVIVSLVVFVFHFIYDKRFDIAMTAAILIGGLILSIPQCIVNWNNLGHVSPKVFTEQVYGYQHSLQNQQLFWGVSMPRYETYIGDRDKYEHLGVYFDDPVGEELLDREGLVVDEFGVKDLVKLFFKYPLDMISIYTKHFVSLMSPGWREMFLTDMYVNKGISIVISFLIWCVAALGLIVAHLNKACKDKCTVAFVLAIILPGLMQAFGAAEIRFFIAVYLVIYYFVFKMVDYGDIYSFFRGNALTMSVAIILAFALWVSVLGDVLSFNRDRILLINDNEQTAYRMLENGESGE